MESEDQPRQPAEGADPPSGSEPGPRTPALDPPSPPLEDAPEPPLNPDPDHGGAH